MRSIFAHAGLGATPVENCANIARGTSDAAARAAAACAADAACASQGIPPGVCGPVAGAVADKAIKLWNDVTGTSAKRRRREERRRAAQALGDARAAAKLAYEFMSADLASTIAGLVSLHDELMPERAGRMGKAPVLRSIEIPGYGKVEYLQFADDNPMRRRLKQVGLYTGEGHEFEAASFVATPPRVDVDPPEWQHAPFGPPHINHLCVKRDNPKDQATVEAKYGPTFFGSVCPAASTRTSANVHPAMIRWRVAQESAKFDESLDRAELIVRNQVVAEAAAEAAQKAVTGSRDQSARLRARLKTERKLSAGHWAVLGATVLALGGAAYYWRSKR